MSSRKSSDYKSKLLVGEGGEAFGVHLTDADIEYELGWLGFSDRKHPHFTDSDELVAIVYDHTYSGELQEGQEMTIEGVD